jgi:hypothetical protein
MSDSETCGALVFVCIVFDVVYAGDRVTLLYVYCAAELVTYSMYK